jgi:hypothetical protein
MQTASRGAIGDLLMDITGVTGSSGANDFFV